jgi:dephospho-CoA kinase
MIKIGLTGGIASGKSSVTQYLRQLGAPVFDADAASRQAVAQGSPGLEQVLQVLGREYALPDGNLDRAKVAAKVFQDPAAKKKLEAVIHTLVWEAAAEFLRRQEAQGSPVVFLDVPLLIECGWYQKVDRVWLVSLSREEQVRRAMLRDGVSAAQVEARMAAQMSLEAKKKFADLVIDNSGSLGNTKKQVADAWEKLQAASVQS